MIVLAGAPAPAEPGDDEILAALRRRLAAGESARDAAAAVATDLGVAKRRAYSLAVDLDP